MISQHTASDSYGQFYPILLNQARMLSEYGFASLMDFTTGLGTPLSTYDFFSLNSFASFWGENNVAYMFGIKHILFVFIAGLFFFSYILLLTEKAYIATISALFYSFCGPILARQLWIGYINEYMLFAIWLWSYEMLIKKRDIRFIPFCTVIMFYNFDAYTTILYIAILSGYIVFRMVWDYDLVVKSYNRLAAIPLIVFGAIFVRFKSIGGMLESIRSAMSTNRFQESTNAEGILESTLTKQNGLLWLDKNELLTLYVRTIGTNTPIKTASYRGIMNYLEDPAFYCGIMTLLLLIPIWMTFCKTKRMLIGLVGMCVAIYIFVNPVRIASNGFVKDTFKLSAFWIVVFVLYVFSIGLDNLLSTSHQTTKSIVFIECILIEILNIYCILETKYEKHSIILVSIFTLLYAIWYVLYVENRANKKWMIVLAICLTFVEVTIQGILCVEHIETIDIDSVGEKKLYNDYTVEALNYIRSRESIGAYRVDKQYTSFGSCDSTGQDFYSYPYYIGGMGIDSKLMDFYEVFDMPSSNSAYNTVYNSGVNNFFDQIIGTKYIISKNDSIPNFGYSLIDKKGDVYIYENRSPMPWLYTLDEYIVYNDFETLSWFDKNHVILNAVILDEEQANDTMCNEYDYSCLESYYSEYEIRINELVKGQYKIKKTNEDDVVFLKVKYTGNDVLYGKQLNIGCNNEQQLYCVNMRPEEEYVFEIESNVESVSFTDYYGKNTIDDVILKAYSVPKMIYSKHYYNIIKKSMDGAAEVEEFSNLRLKAKINVENDGILCTTVPYGNTLVMVDNQLCDSYRINYGMTGCDISKGIHVVELIYGKKMGVLDVIHHYLLIILCALFALIISLMRLWLPLSCLENERSRF